MELSNLLTPLGLFITIESVSDVLQRGSKDVQKDYNMHDSSDGYALCNFRPT
jgi:hypothetical protein